MDHSEEEHLSPLPEGLEHRKDRQGVMHGVIRFEFKSLFFFKIYILRRSAHGEVFDGLQLLPQFAGEEPTVLPPVCQTSTNTVLDLPKDSFILEDFGKRTLDGLEDALLFFLGLPKENWLSLGVQRGDFGFVDFSQRDC